MMVAVLEKRSLGKVISMSAAWDAQISRRRSDATRVRAILKAFPGAGAYGETQRSLYETDREDYVLPF